MIRDHALVLMYHSVAPFEADPFWMRVQPEHFEAHLRYLSQHADVVPLDAISERGRGRRVAITLDDGYADNAQIAAPLLAEAGLPATVFVATDGLNPPHEVWYDRLERLVLNAPAEVTTLDVTVASRPVRVDIRTPEGRRRAIHAIERRIRPLPTPEIAASMQPIADQLGDRSSPARVRPQMTPSELVGLAAQPLIGIGAHTCRHPMLSSLSRAEQWDEIAGSRDTLGELLGGSIDAFAYPFGHRESFTDVTVGLVHDAGFKLACTTVTGRVTRRTSRYRIPRLPVWDADGETFAARIEHAFDGEMP